jgi:branched-chain amino acid transport system permease protein
MHFDTLFDSFWSFTVTGLANGSIYALVALGYTLVYGVLRLINFAHSEVFMMGYLA